MANLFVCINVMNFVIILEVNKNQQSKDRRNKKKTPTELRDGSPSLQGRQASGRVSPSDPKRLLFIKLIYPTFDSDIRICSLHNSVVSNSQSTFKTP